MRRKQAIIYHTDHFYCFRRIVVRSVKCFEKKTTPFYWKHNQQMYRLASYWIYGSRMGWGDRGLLPTYRCIQNNCISSFQIISNISYNHPEHLSSPPVFNGVRVTRSLVLCVCFVDRCLSFCTFSFGHCIVYPSSIYGLWLPLWYLQNLLWYINGS